MKLLTTVALLILFSIDSRATSLSGFFVDSNKFFRSWIYQGKVDYGKINKNSAAITDLYEQINQMDLQSASEAEKQAFYINAYNLIVIYQVSRHYPIKSPLNQDGFFDKVKHTVAGEDVTLNALEIEKLMLTYQDPRVHFVLACGAQSWPPLASFAYLPRTLDRQMEDRTRKTINDPAFIRVTKDTVELSKIFDWYQHDFIQNGQTVLDFVNEYRIRKILDSQRISYYEYDWRLNDL